jgi:hypothetical protein
MASGGLGAVQSAIDGVIGPVKNLLSSIPIIGGAFAALPTSLGGFTSMIEETLGRMKDMIVGAQKLGVSLDTLGGIQVIAGAKADDMQRAMFHMARTIGEVNSGSLSAAENMLRIGFAADAFKGKSMDQALGMVMDKIKGLADPFEKAYVAQQLFGRTGVDLVPILSKGSSALEEASKKARQLGLSFSALDAAGVMKAKSSMKEINLVVEGMKRSLAVEMAPIVSTIAENFSSWLKSVGGMRGAFRELANFTGTFMGNLIEALNKVVVLFERIDRRMQQMDNAGSTAGKVTDTAFFIPSRLLSFLGGDKNAINTEGYAAVSSSLHNLADQLKDVDGWWNRLNITTAKGEDVLPNAALMETIKKVGELEQTLSSTVEAYGRNTHQVALNKLAHEGATPAILRAAQARVNEIETLERITDRAGGAATALADYRARAEQLTASLRAGTITQARFAAGIGDALDRAVSSMGRAAPALNMFDEFREKASQLQTALRNGQISAEGFVGGMNKIGEALEKSMGSKATELFTATRNPLEQAEAKVQELNQLLMRGAIDWEVYSRSVYGAAKSLIDLNHAQEARMSGAQEFGSQEAFATINRAMISGKGNDSGMARLNDTVKQLLDVAKREQRDIDEIAWEARRGFLAIGRI